VDSQFDIGLLMKSIKIMDIITKAKELAEQAHKDHVRNDETKTPYILHLAEVVELVTESGGSEEEIVAGWLHDVVEDTPTTIADIHREFGDQVGEMVAGLTDLPEWLTLTLQERKLKQAERVAHESASVKRVKLADQVSNIQIVGMGNLNFVMAENYAYLDTARKIAEVCQGISPYLDKLFIERYNAALKNLKDIEEKRNREV